MVLSGLALFAYAVYRYGLVERLFPGSTGKAGRPGSGQVCTSP